MTLLRMVYIRTLFQVAILVRSILTYVSRVLEFSHVGKENCGTVKPANVISTSYGYNEADLSPAYTARQCAEYVLIKHSVDI